MSNPLSSSPPLTHLLREPGSTMLAPPFFILLSWNIPKHIVRRQAPYWIEMGFFGKKVWYHNKMNETLRSKLLPSSTLSSPLGNNRPNLPSAQLPPAGITGFSFPEFLSWNISEDIRIHTFSEAELPQPSRDEVG